MKKVMFISSTGGHLNELLQLKPLFEEYNSYLVTEKTKSNIKLTEKYNVPGFLIYGTKDRLFSYPFKLLANCFISLYLFLKIRPDVVVTTGAHTCGPVCCLAKIFRKKVIYIETFANSNSKTITGTLLYTFADVFIVQWEDMLKLYPGAIYGGWIY